MSSPTPISFTLDDDRRAFIEKQAEKLRLNRSEWLRRVIDELMAKEASEEEKPS